MHCVTTSVQLLFHCAMEICKVEQHSCTKEADLYSKKAQECHAQQREALSDHVLGHQTVAR
jgi:hypothetical protein